MYRPRSLPLEYGDQDAGIEVAPATDWAASRNSIVLPDEAKRLGAVGCVDMCISLDETNAVVAEMLRWHFSAARGRDRRPRPCVRRLVSMDFAIAPAGTATLPTIDTAACRRTARCPGEAGRLELGGAVWLFVTLDYRGAVQKHGGDEAAIRALATTCHFNPAIGTDNQPGPSISERYTFFFDLPPRTFCDRPCERSSSPLPCPSPLSRTPTRHRSSTTWKALPRTERALTIVSGGDEVGSLRVSEAA